MPVRRTRKSPHSSGQTTLDGDTTTYARDAAGIREFQKMVLDHYEQHGRKMAWRETTSPYHILVSEIMLQQTQVERAAVKFPEFMEAFPDFPALADAPLSRVLEVWQGMGYNRRAIALQKCAIRVIGEFNGILPREPETLATFPGIGPATAASICAFAFNLPVVFIETNIRRVFIHFFFTDRDEVNDKEILPLAGLTLYKRNPRVWYWALMDLGTALKKTVANPNRRSAHYTKQAPFEGSDRKIRGKILNFLIVKAPVSKREIVNAVAEEEDRTGTIIAALIRDGFLKERKDLYYLSE